MHYRGPYLNCTTERRRVARAEQRFHEFNGAYMSGASGPAERIQPTARPPETV